MMSASKSFSNVLSATHEEFPKVKMCFQFVSNDHDNAAHQILSQVLDSVALSGQDTKVTEKITSIALS